MLPRTVSPASCYARCDLRRAWDKERRDADAQRNHKYTTADFIILFSIGHEGIRISKTPPKMGQTGYFSTTLQCATAYDDEDMQAVPNAGLNHIFLQSISCFFCLGIVTNGTIRSVERRHAVRRPKILLTKICTRPVHHPIQVITSAADRGRR